VKRLVVVLAALVSAQSGWAAPAPLRVTSISPAVADRGGLVTIAGGGFGARNLEVSVGGEPVELVTATGNTASFRVPALGPVGEVVVEARNPGEHAGRIGLTVRFDGHTAAVADVTAAVTAAVGGEGGTIAVGGMELAIPAGAVPEGTEITATPLRSLQGSPFAATPVGLKLEPSGLVLLRPATLTLPRPAGVGVLVGFGFDGAGEGFHLVPHRLSGDTVQLQVWHFSGAGVLTASLGELAAVLRYEPTPAHELAEQRIAAALVDAQVNGSDPGAAVFAALRDWRTSSVSQGLSIARTTTRLDFFELAFGEWLAWLAYLQQYRDTLAPADSSFFDTAVSEIDRPSATNAAAAVARRRLERCLGPDLPRAALRDVIRVAAAVNLAGLPIQETEANGERALPEGPDLPGACVDVRITAIEHAAAFARNRDNRFAVRAEVVFWSGGPSTTVPLRYRLAGIATETTSNGRFSLTRRPSELGSDELQLTVDLDTNGTDTVLRTIFEQRQLSIPVRERLELHARRTTDAAFTDTIGTVAPGGTVLLRIRLAGDTINGVPITLTHDATGTLPATATTGTNGEATVTYTAPATAPTEVIELVNATVTDNGLVTGDALVITTRQRPVVTVTPSFGFVSAGGTLQLSASVTGTGNHAVTWSATGGSVDGNGLYTGGNSAGVFTVTATSIADPTATGTAFVQITTEDVTGIYAGDRCYPGFCEPVTVSYSCAWQSFVGSGTVCGWFSADFASFVPSIAPFCLVETTGTRSGGPFTGEITFCRFSPASSFSNLSVSGSIGRGRLVFQVRVSDYPDPGSTHVESYDLLKVG
jgi:IPT/TIG domain-containing protein